MEDKEKKDFDVIFAFAFGSPEDLISNHNIAERVKELYINCGMAVPVITQRDIFYAIPFKTCSKIYSGFNEKGKRLFKKNIIVYDDNKYYIEGYPSTLKLIKVFSVFFAKKYNCKKVLVIAAPMHAKRCVRDLRKMGFDAYEDKDLRAHYNMSSIWWYHHNSTQFWTRSAFFWWPREIILRLLPWKIYEWYTCR